MILTDEQLKQTTRELCAMLNQNPSSKEWGNSYRTMAKKAIIQWLQIQEAVNRVAGEMKPDWKDAPKWANWLAMDENGTWMYFEQKPEICLETRMWFSRDGECQAIGIMRNWKESLQERPKK